MTGFTAGQLVTLTDERRARIRFVGTTRFAPGEWLGLELEDATGKNDGSVQGERYFDCEHGHGMFIRASAVASILEQPKKPVSRAGSKSSTDGRGRPASTVAGGGPATMRQSMLSSSISARRQSSSASSPSPAPRLAGRSLRSPTKSPTKQLTGSSLSSSVRAPSSTAKPATPAIRPRPSLANRGSMPPPSATGTTGAKPARLSLSGSTTRAPKSTLQSRTNVAPVVARRTSLRPVFSETASEGVESAVSERSEESAPSPQPPDDADLVVPKAASRGLLSISNQRSVSGSNAIQKEIEDLKTKLRVMEKKRSEDREKLKTIETYRAERDKFEGIIQKLQAKYQPQQQEITSLRKQLKEAEQRVEQVERIQAEHESILEMATLDREMAEEVAEATKAEYEALKIRAEELELEVDVLREENQELGEVMSPEQKSSQGWLQMERTNERLREALIRLRDITQQQEADLKSQVQELEEELEEYTKLKAQYESTKEKLLITEANMEDLKQQVEALGAEEMIEDLTEKNMQYQEEVNELKAVIEDLESLKELNDELELNHMESEKQLQEEIDYRESVHHDQSRKIAHQAGVIEDLEYTLSKFRELVTNLHTDLEDMRASQQISETEANDLTLRSRSMMDLNMKLQASVAKAQVKSLDVELSRMDAEESSKHLSIVKTYLPDYYEAERNSTLALLRFKRVAFKARLMGNTIKERLSDPSPSSFSDSDDFAAYDALEKLTWIFLLSDRFDRFMHRCSTDEFGAFEGALFELEPVERILNYWIENLKKGELNEKKCADELQRSVALLSHLSESLIPPHVEGYGDEMLMKSILTQTYLDSSASCLALLKLLLQSKLPASASEEDESQYFYKKLDSLAQQMRGVKVAMSKVTRSLDELRDRSLSLSEACGQAFELTEQSGKELSSLIQKIGGNILQLSGEEGLAEPLHYADALSNMCQTIRSFTEQSPVGTGGGDILTFLGNKLHILIGYVDEASSLASDLSQTIEFEHHPHPWLERGKQLKAQQIKSQDSEDEIRRLKFELQEASNALGAKDRIFQEQSIKIELLESRMKEAGKKAAVVQDLETKVEKLRAKEHEFVDIIEKQSRGLEAMERERDEYRGRLEKLKRASVSDESSGAEGAIPSNAAASLSIMRENEALRAEVASLQAAVRYVRDDNKRAHLLDPYAVQRTYHLRSWLDTPLTRPKRYSPDYEGNLASETRDVFNYLLKLTKDSKLVDLKAQPSTDNTNRLAWRPIKSTPRYHVLKQREQYEQWNQWKSDVVCSQRVKPRNLKRNTQAGSASNVQGQLSTRPALSQRSSNTQSFKKEAVMGEAWKILDVQPGDDDLEYSVSGDVQIIH
ncbi:hypothetical protein FQN57_006047 [Myotisia sp. PD_48]|nr:hypothetical protein FQN57_006047 [Myotisia sp. PD_48]